RLTLRRRSRGRGAGQSGEKLGKAKGKAIGLGGVAARIGGVTGHLDRRHQTGRELRRSRPLELVLVEYRLKLGHAKRALHQVVGAGMRQSIEREQAVEIP